jgi:hypothetical protein
MSGGGRGTTTQTVQNYSPEEVARRTQLQDEAKRIYEANKDQYGVYPGSPPVQPASETLAAENYLRAIVPGQIRNVEDIQKATRFGLSDVLYPGSNPALQQTINATIRPITESYMDPGGVFSQIRTGAMDAGQFGGSRQGIAEGVAAGRYANAIGDAAAKVATEGYNKGLDTFSRTLAFAPSAMQTSMVPAQTLASVGASIEGRGAEQAAFEEAQRLWQLNAPWLPLQNYANLIYGGGSSGQTVSGNVPGPTTAQRLMGGLGGAAAGASLWSALPTAVAGFPALLPMMAIGGLLGMSR